MLCIPFPKYNNKVSLFKDVTMKNSRRNIALKHKSPLFGLPAAAAGEGGSFHHTNTLSQHQKGYKRFFFS